MTNPPFEPGRVSAYLDGELTAEERAAFEVRLQNNPELQRELAELQSLGKLLSDLPWHRLDENFAHEVDIRCDDLRPCAFDDTAAGQDVCGDDDNLTATVAETDASDVTAGSDINNVSTTPTGGGVHNPGLPQRRRSLLRTLAAPGLVAAGLVAAVLFWQSRLEPPREIVATRDTPVTLPEDYLQRTQEINANTPASLEKDGVAESPAGEPVDSPAPAAHNAIAHNAGSDTQRYQLKPESEDGAGHLALNIKRTAPGAAFPPGEKPATGGRQAPMSPGDRTPGLEFGRDLRSAAIGETVEAVDRDGDSVRVVQLTVVDRVQGLRNLQVLLERHNIRTDARPTGKPAQPGGSSGKPGENKQSHTGILPHNATNGTADSQLLAVLVEADPAQLNAALAQLLHDQKFTEIHSDTTLAQANVSRWLAASGQQEFATLADESHSGKREAQLAAAGAGQSRPFRRQDRQARDRQISNGEKRLLVPALPRSPVVPVAQPASPGDAAPDSVVAASDKAAPKAMTDPRKFSAKTPTETVRGIPPVNASAGRTEAQPSSGEPADFAHAGISPADQNGHADSRSDKRNPGGRPHTHAGDSKAATAKVGRQTVVSVPAELLATLKLRKNSDTQDRPERGTKKFGKVSSESDAQPGAAPADDSKPAPQSKSAHRPVLIVFVTPAESPAAPPAAPQR